MTGSNKNLTQEMRNPDGSEMILQHGSSLIFDSEKFWKYQVSTIQHNEHDFKNHVLPLARIKRVMKTEDVKMISAETLLIFEKGCEIFISELTMRAWIHAEESKRRTLQRSDIAAATTKSDVFDFLIDIVPREEALASAKSTAQKAEVPTPDMLAYCAHPPAYYQGQPIDPAYYQQMTHEQAVNLQHHLSQLRGSEKH
ncbi:uncharacterized protein VTP21DRAFT_4362 [Calcarisporiella thermophila]|uniref:uncharacterized protein n=1 Tax=Calcarisporiella thermophila TaxID=911321 RepID=UPI00374435A6